ncbi:MAG: 2-oxoacid:acceptor oxidoreductase subunit alpha [Calditrichaeota bacterium]|nr:MAG: 2-oxoacid:acceptor oxidoreductase subunit alpha [Calditrichota bacterium]MBL1204263.1 2-oxoacid:acceptor oxidoreductase subunit alpha [Calditrichota bacterium]NOG44093.1 2-oxoacid:acceptor oxidoreductase subunit alpha [Calditrichota bacterium]
MSVDTQEKNQKLKKRITIRFAGDSGDGIQLTGSQFTSTTAVFGNDLSTFPDYPAEIRAPAGTLFGVSGFQIQFSSDNVHTPGDDSDVLIAMNPAALKVSLSTLKENGIIIVNKDSFTTRNLKLAGYDENPLEDRSLDGYQVFDVPITTLTRESLIDSPLTSKEKDRCKNFFALGVAYWMFTRPMDTTLEWIKAKFKNKPDIIEANSQALNAGYSYALSTEIFTTSYHIEQAKVDPGIYRNITGNEAIVLGLITAAKKASLELFMGGYPITPASDILHYMAKYRNYDVKTFQAEDEIAGVGAAIGASYAGALGVTASSGPGIALKGEFLGYAVMMELPLVAINIQRGGPSTGLPTKTEQADLFQALYGRNGEAPIPVVAAQSPADCFDAAYEAAKISVQFSTPVFLLSDGYIANGAEPWLIPDPDKIDEIKVRYADPNKEYQPYLRDPETLSRHLSIPGTKGHEHRLGGLEKEDISGNVSYDPDNHDKMVRLREEKVNKIRDFVEDPQMDGQEQGDLLIITWGSTYGTMRNVVDEMRKNGDSISWYHLRWINPLPQNLAKFIHNFKHVIIPELNMGQLIRVIRSEYLVDAKPINQVKGLPFSTNEVIDAIDEIMKGSNNA